MSSAPRIGDRVHRVSGDYTMTGTVVSVFSKLSGVRRIVVEMDTFGVLFIGNEEQWKALPPGGGS